MTRSTATVVDESDALDVSPADVADRPVHDRILLVSPTHFDVAYAINPYMGGEVDRDRATAQWESLRDAYERVADSVAVLDPDETWERVAAGAGAPSETVGARGRSGENRNRSGENRNRSGREQEPAPPTARPDLVFAANLGLPTADGRGVVLASMATAERRGEPAYLAAWAAAAGYEVHDPPPAAFEGTGDAVWHPGKRLLWGGYGVRTDRAAYDDLAERLDATVLALELTDDRYYHLDVCLQPLDGTTALVQPEAFTDDGLDRLASVFERLLEVPTAESREGLAGNAHCVDGERVLLPAGNPGTESILSEAGYEPVPIDTGEFQKAGGSVFCLKLALGRPA